MFRRIRHLRTGPGGEDGTHLYDPTIFHIYAGPYVILEHKKAVCGYVLGALDSEVFFGRRLLEVKKQVPDGQLRKLNP